MASFLFRCARYLLVLAAFLTVNRAANAWLLGFHEVRWERSPRALVLGDSHVQASINPDKIDGVANLAQLAEPFVATFYKLLWIFRTGAVPVVLLGFDPHNLAPFNDDKFRDDDLVPEMAKRYAGILPWWRLEGMPLDLLALGEEEVRSLWLPSPHLIGDLARQLAGHPSAEHGYVGRFDALDSNDLSQATLDGLIARHFAPAPDGGRVSSIQEAYLRRIVRLCLDRSTTLVLVATPAHPDYRARIPGPLEARYRLVWNELVNVPGVVGLDLSALPLKRLHYANHDHTNRRGAAIVSAAVREFLDRLESDRGAATGQPSSTRSFAGPGAAGAGSGDQRLVEAAPPARAAGALSTAAGSGLGDPSSARPGSR